MFKVGDFSRIARVSARLLRYYDEIGLFRPAIVERDTGYRYYRASQLQDLNRILTLRELGFPLEDITRMVGSSLSDAELKQLLLQRQTTLQQSLTDDALRLRQVQSRLEVLDAETADVVPDVLIRSEPERQILSARKQVSGFVEAREWIGVLLTEARRLTGRKNPGQLVVIAHAPEFEADAIDVEVGFILAGDGTDAVLSAAVLQPSTLPAVERMVTAVRVGPPEEAHKVTGLIGLYLERNGLQMDGPSRELFLQPFNPADPRSAIVEMQFPAAQV